MQSQDKFKGLHNCLQFYQLLLCLYQAMQTRKKISIIMLNCQMSIFLVHFFLWPADVTTCWLHSCPLTVENVNLKNSDHVILTFLHFCSQDADNVWWDAFAAEFFDDDATLTLSFCLEDGPKRYCMCFLARI